MLAILTESSTGGTSWFFRIFQAFCRPKIELLQIGQMEYIACKIPVPMQSFAPLRRLSYRRLANRLKRLGCTELFGEGDAAEYLFHAGFRKAVAPPLLTEEEIYAALQRLLGQRTVSAVAALPGQEKASALASLPRLALFSKTLYYVSPEADAPALTELMEEYGVPVICVPRTAKSHDIKVLLNFSKLPPVGYLPVRSALFFDLTGSLPSGCGIVSIIYKIPEAIKGKIPQGIDEQLFFRLYCRETGEDLKSNPMEGFYTKMGELSLEKAGKRLLI